LDVLKWKSRRGLLENDLILQRFFQKYERTLSSKDKFSLKLLLDLNDNDLLDLFLKRSELTESLDNPDVRDILEKLRGL
jgi:antitoxin CptB